MYRVLRVLNSLPNILYETSSDTYFNSFRNEETRILISVHLPAQGQDHFRASHHTLPEIQF
jgi:hypothetical protein